MATNWRELPPGRELDRMIAERLGWRAVEYKGLWYLLPPDCQDTLMADAEQAFGRVGIRSYSSADAAWEFDRASPRFSTSIDDMLTLFPPDCEIQMEYAAWGAKQEWAWHVWPHWINAPGLAIGMAKHLAHAGCLAWLLCDEKVGRPDGTR